MVAWLAARAAGGTLVLRVEDIDTPRVVSGSEQRQLEDLHWLGLDWDEGPDVGGPHAPHRQSERTALYDHALDELARAGHLYRCDCSRAEIARIASAPHADDAEVRYPGTCREKGMSEHTFRRPPALRLRMPPGVVTFVDGIAGQVRSDVEAATGDVVLRRADGVTSYQLAVVVDDLAMGITEIVRGADLLSSTPRQIRIAELLGGRLPATAHVPLVVGPDGQRLAKRARGISLRHHRDAGTPPDVLIGRLAHALGLIDDDAPRTPRSLVGGFDRSRLHGRTEVRVPASLLL